MFFLKKKLGSMEQICIIRKKNLTFWFKIYTQLAHFYENLRFYIIILLLIFILICKKIPVDVLHNWQTLLVELVNTYGLVVS